MSFLNSGSSVIIGIICTIIIILILHAYFESNQNKESFDVKAMGLIFDNYVTNKSAQRSYESKTKAITAPQPFKKIGLSVPVKTFISDMLDNTIGLNKPEPKCLSCEGAINKTVFFKQGPTHYLGYDYKTNTIRMVSKASVSADQFIKCCQWKLVLGLSGDANTCSILHMEQDAYLSRLPDTAQVKGSLLIIPAEVAHGNELARQMATFRLIDGLHTRSAVSIMPLSIGKETRVRVAEIAASGVPHIVEYANEHVVDYKAATFDCVDSINEYPVISNRFTVNGNHLCSNSALTQDTAHSNVFEPFQDSSNGPNKRCSKSSSKRLLAACVDEGELTNAELSKAELFQNVNTNVNTTQTDKPTTTNPLFATEFNPLTANIFDSHTGAEFNAILNTGVSQKRNELTDNIFYKLENAKMDPDVNNLLEYNETRYNIYKKENGDFESKIYDRIKKHTDTVDGLIIDMNNYRVKNMAQDFFFLNDKLIKSRGSNNN
jgi:hypothetical protein